MSNQTALRQTGFWKWSILCGIIISIFALLPQIDLWVARGTDWNGSYALTDLDEPFYAAYLNSLMEGKPRLNSPTSGAIDTPETPQYESQLSIQFMAVYPLLIISKVFNLSVSSVFILSASLFSFLTAFFLYWLIYLFTKDNFSAFFITLIVLFGGAIVAGQGLIFSILTGKGVHYTHALFVMRQYLPAVSFPSLFLFPIFIWKYLNAQTAVEKIKPAVLAFLTFGFGIFSYFYTWTAALAWLGTLGSLWAIFNFEDIKKNFLIHLGFFFALISLFIPYYLLVSNRSLGSDAVIILQKTREFDLFRLTEIIGYLTTAIFILFKQFKLIEWKDNRIIFLLSFNLVIPVLFNQQVISGLSMQPYHYEFFSGNYFVLISLFTLIVIALKEKIDYENFKRILVYASVLPIGIAIFDTGYTTLLLREMNVWRDEFKPIAERVKTISNEHKGVVLSFDLSETKYANATDLPAFSSQPVLWNLHLYGHPDMGLKGARSRLMQFLYYQNIAPETLKAHLHTQEKFLASGFFSGDRVSDLYTGKVNPITREEIIEIGDEYQKFIENFSAKDAQAPLLSFVIINNTVENEFSKLDLWYERDAGEIMGDYTIFRVKLRDN